MFWLLLFAGLFSVYSTLTEEGEGGHLFRPLIQSCCGEGGTRQTNITGVWGALAVSGPHRVWPRSRRVLSRSALLRLRVSLPGNCLRRALGCEHFPGLSGSGACSRALHRGTDSAGPAFCALPGQSRSGDPVPGEPPSPRLGLRLIVSPSQLLGFLGGSGRAFSSHLVSLPGS